MAPGKNFISFLTLLLIANSYLAGAARSRRRPSAARPAGSLDNPTEYDRSITTFNSEGRLLQVEYGSIAAGRGETVSFFDLDCIDLHPSATNGRRLQGIVVCVVRNAKPKSGTSHQLLIDKVHRIDHHAILVTSGLSGDSATLADVARGTCLNARMSNGEHSTLKEIADAVGSTQHQLTRTDGRRPFGVSAAIIGIDPIPNSAFVSNNDGVDAGDIPLPGTPALYRSDPGGSVDRCDYCAIGKGADKATDALESILKSHSTEHDSEEGEEASTNIATQTHAEVITEVALAALDTEGESSSAEEENEDDSDKSIQRTVDIWLIDADPKKRGGARFRVARSVDRESLVEASRRLIQ